MTLAQLLKRPEVRGLCVGCCVDGSNLPTDVLAHAHIEQGRLHGWICIKSPRAVLKPRSRHLSSLMMHELSHLLADSGHTDQWRATMQELGQVIPAAYKKRKRA